MEWSRNTKTGGVALMDKVGSILVKEGDKLLKKASGHVSAHAKQSLNVAVITLEKTVKVDEEPIDFTDLEEVALVDTDKGWRAKKVIKVCNIILYLVYFSTLLLFPLYLP